MTTPSSTSPDTPRWIAMIHANRGLIVPVGFVFLMIVLLVPMPPPVLDLLIALNISVSVVILLTTLYMDRPLEFSVFPSLLLATTLLRLVLNVASTRLILTADAETPEQAMGVAGKVIQAFGQFVAGDSLFVGVVIFLILVIVQFMVVTKGAGRISEVAARFTLDAMPGKQMAIDSDLNAGLIDEAEARARREEIAREADFFGAMDGASKFVRGDSIAGIIITAINILGGFAIGMIDRGWPAAQTAETFTKLTIGDGLTAQIPSLIISIASALIVTRSGSKDELGRELADQLVSQPKGLFICSVFLALLSLTPLPTLPLLATSGVLGALAWFMIRKHPAQGEDASSGTEAQPMDELPEPPIEAVLKVDTLELEIGYGLVALVDKAQGGDLLARINAARRQLAAELGLVMPPVRIRDNVKLEPDAYRIKIRGVPIAQGIVRPGKLLAMDAGLASSPLDGERTREPAFGLDAWWIDPALRQRAEAQNYTVVEATSVLTTHLSEIVRAHADELLTREEVNNLIEQLKERAPRLVEEAIPSIVKAADIQRVCQALLRERIPIRDMETIVEALADWAPKTPDPDVLIEYVRNALRRTICAQVAVPQDDGTLKILCVALDPSLEDRINAHIDRSGGTTSVAVPPRLAEQIASEITRALEGVTSRGHPSVVVASPQVRAVVRQILEGRIDGVWVLGYNEIVPEIEVETVALVSLPSQQAAA